MGLTGDLTNVGFDAVQARIIALAASGAYATTETINVSKKSEQSDAEPLGKVLEKLNKLNIYSFVSNEDNNRIQYGIASQDVLNNIPEAIYVSKEKNNLLEVYTNNIIYLLLKAVQELSSEIEELKQTREK